MLPARRRQHRCRPRPNAGQSRTGNPLDGDATMNEQGPDLKGLQSFASQTDREESAIFVGRERETEHVLRQAELVGEVHAEGRNTQGATIVITGCPGSGKSAFLGHFARTFAKLELSNTVLIPVECSHLDLTARNTEEVQAQLARLAVRREEGLHKTFQALLKDAGQALKLRNTFERLEQKISEEAGKRTVVCLLVDEIQNVTEASAGAVQLLHTRSFAPPVLPIYAGLDDAVDRLRTVCGISRLSDEARMPMGPLRENASREAAKKLFEKYRVRADEGARAAWTGAIDAEALDFAQHLHVSLKAASSVLTEHEGAAQAEDAPEVRRRARAARERFYSSKIGGIVEYHEEAMLDVVHRATRPNTRVSRRGLTEWAREHMHRRSPAKTEYSEAQAEALVQRMRHEGILHITDDRRGEVAIPSLHTWLTGTYARQIGWEPTAQKRAQDRKRGQ